MTDAGGLGIAVIVATLGRPEIVTATVSHLMENQTVRPQRIMVSCVTSADAGGLSGYEDIEVIIGPKGSSAQRNTALDQLGPDTGIVVFFDDDFVADKDWLASASETFRASPDIAGFTGRVLADGIKGPGLTFEEAVSLTERGAAPVSWTLKEPFSPYGCNMAFRRSAIGAHRFDERLVLYGWLEDRDFAASIARNGGRFVKCASAKGVHMGIKRGRVRGDQFGYSQVVNPFYMLRKKTMSPLDVADQVSRNLLSNLLLSLSPEPYIDRRGRLKGNMLGLSDLARGRLRPERAAELSR